MSLGRPTTYTKELAETICARIAAGDSVRKIGSDPDMPAQSTIHLWVIKNIDNFSERYAEAKAIGAEVEADEINNIAETYEDLARAKLIIDTKKWNLAKKLPGRFGDRVAVDNKISGRLDVNNINELPDEELINLATGSQG